MIFHENRNSIFSCEKCKYKSSHEAKLDRHMKSMHGDNCYLCNQCSFISQSRQSLLGHKKQVHKQKKVKENILKYPMPPRPVLSMTKDETKSWFPKFFLTLSHDLKNNSKNGHPLPTWMKDIEDVICFSTLKNINRNWSTAENGFFWKLKLVSAIVLDQKGID